MKKLVSVVITSHNYSQYINCAIESILNQTYSNLELIIIDDGSTDNSLDVINAYKQNENVLIISRPNKGIVYTRNEGLELARGKYLFFLDADDYFNSDYIEKMVAVAEKTGADVVYPNWRVFGDKEYTKEFPAFSLQGLITQEFHCTSESLIRMSSIGKHKFQSEDVAEDWDFFLGLALAGKRFVHAPNCYINYRVRSNTRGTSHPYWEDVRIFHKILSKWQKKYPEQIDPLDLLIYAGKVRDDHIKSQEAIIQEKDAYIGQYDTVMQEKDAYIKELQSTLKDVRSSRAYKVSRLITAPLRGAKKMLKRK